ncbi:ATP-binding protein [Bowmanella denitrificans]|uniref:histidine kinase n=1 Tax=Bowmanella denitrificans TaxID=366582 RepID=A0ABN0XBV4_9ALTE
MQHFSQGDYGAHNQNWAVLQHPNGLMYFGNTDGILEFDGLRWRLIRVANDTAVRSLALGNDGKVLVGAMGELGYLAADQYGHMRYHSLTEQVPESMQGFSDVWQIFVLPDGVYFRTSARLLRWDGDAFHSWEPEVAFHRTFQIGQRLLIRQVNFGLFELIDDELRLLAGGERFAGELIYSVLPWDQDGKTLLVGTRSQGFWLFDGQNWTPWLTEAGADIKRDLIYQAIWLPGERLGVATEQGGLYILNRDGKWVEYWDRNAGLPDNSIRYAYLDQQQGLWLALNRGISRIEAGGQFSQYDETNGLPGTVNIVHRHQGQLYAGTSQGLFALLPGSQARFKAIEGIRGQTWDFLSFEQTGAKAQSHLLVANGHGLFDISADQITNLQPLQTSQSCLVPSAVYPGRIYICTYGLTAIEYRDGDWQDLGKVPGMDDEIRSMLETEDGQLWLGTRSTGVLRLQLPSGGSLAHPAKIERFGMEHGLPDLNWNNVFMIEGSPAFTTLHGWFRFDQSRQRFVPDHRFAGLFDGEPRRLGFPGKPVTSPDGRIWAHSSNKAVRLSELGAVIQQAEGSYRWDRRPLAALHNKSVVPMLLEPDGTLWLGGADGLVSFNTLRESDYTQPFRVLLRHVSERDGAVLYGGSSDSRHIQHATPLTPKPRLRFEFAATSYNSLTANRFQYRLEGLDKDWSPWTSDAFTDYSNLWEGHYRFHVRAKNRFGLISEEAVFAFQVLPPWYRSWWAYAGYVLGLILLGWLGLQVYFHQLAARNRELTREVHARTRDLESALTELRETQQELVESEKMATAGRLVAGMAHQINTPVGNGQVTASMLLDQVHDVRTSLQNQQLGRQKLEKFLDTWNQGLALIVSSLERVGNLVQNLRKITEASQDCQSEWFELEHILAEVESKLRQQAQRQGVRILFHCTPGLKIHCNWIALTDCIQELVDNSLTYGFLEPGQNRSKQEITIDVSEVDDTIVMHYQDNGQGIRPELRDRIFEPFAASMHGNYMHPGLGMHRLFSVIKLTLQGHIELTASNEGVHFVIKLPRQIGPNVRDTGQNPGKD